MQQRLLQWEVPSGLCQKRCRCCDSCLYKELEEYTSSLTIALQFRQLRLANATELKSDNLQYNTLVRWFAGTNDLLTKRLMFQALFL
jgi:hypothetical protein